MLPGFQWNGTSIVALLCTLSMPLLLWFVIWLERKEK
jgi:hypothetical protein